ncbi:POP1-domain-containing protein [Cristinia sonorae]|uniref:POP1-domain-containing protein n=1 Tax=Cristinia sonorae TaxID=1940300 RepID=A0A8K0UVX8_9AGAR|nr:POP1-domain-containing protein [Cristinia sonorae]
MPSKRKNDEPAGPAETTGREKKKQKTVAARTIPVQDATSSGPSNTQSQTANAEAGPSRSVRFEGKQLPGSLDVERFAEARAFEINAMHTAMQTARQSASHRAWQELPRHLRRRAASHDVRRVPLRLRDKARAEMDPMRKKALRRKHPQHGKDKKLQRTEPLLKRQKDKVWLETHIWHAKRMKMENMWGYRLAVQPTEKAFRPSHRASVHGSILHDASYYGFLEMCGPEAILRSVFERCCDPQSPSPSAPRFLTGARACDTHIYKPGAYPFGLIAPVTVIWQSSKDTMHEEPGPRTVHKAKHPKHPNEDNLQVKSTPIRSVWVRVHPSIFTEVYIALQTAASYALDAAKAANGADSKVVLSVEIADLRERLNVFEIMGAKSSQVLKGALKPLFEKGRKDFATFWDSLGNLQTTASLPRNMIIGFTVNDPRLSFPPKNAHVQLKASNPMSTPVANIFPSSHLALSGIWDEKARDQLKKPKYKKKDLDERRAQNVVPGTSLQPKQQDDRIPILLIQRSLESLSEGATPGSSSNADASSSLHGWTLIIPSGWAMPFFSSLIYTGTRVAGQRERQTQFFEAGKSYFPRDYPFTESYQAFADDRKAEDEAKWLRKPPAKRPNYEALQTRSPWIPDWEVVLEIAPSTQSSNLITTQRAVQDDTDPSAPAKKKIRPWLLRGCNVQKVLDEAGKMFNRAVGLYEQINQLKTKKGLDALDNSIRPDDLWRGALVRVKLKMCTRGRPDDLAMIYRVDDDEHAEWVVSTNKAVGLEDEDESKIELANRQTPPSDIIGYVTTGNFSLSLGKAFAIGAVSVSRLFDLRDQAARLGKHPHLLVKVRDRGEQVHRAAYLHLLEE